MARGVGKLCWGKNENWGSEEQNEKEGKRGKEKEEKEKGESDFFVYIAKDCWRKKMRGGENAKQGKWKKREHS